MVSLANVFSLSCFNKIIVEKVARDAVMSESVAEEVFRLSLSADEKIAWHALWVCDVMASLRPELLEGRREQFQKMLLRGDQNGKKRLLLSILFKMSVDKDFSIEVLNKCLDDMVSLRQPPAVCAVAMKLAYKMCLFYPDLMSEFRAILDSMEDDFLPPAVRSTRRNLLKDMRKNNK